MSHPDALRWDDRYTREAERYTLRGPRHLVTSHLDLLPRGGLVLDAACGTTSTGRYLAARGWRVIALDVSIAALRLARLKACTEQSVVLRPGGVSKDRSVQKEALPVSFAVMDMTDLWLPEAYFEVILNFFFLSRPLWSTYRRSLKPGGSLFFETFLREADVNPAHYLDSLELHNAFNDWEVIHYAEIQRHAHARDGADRTRRVAQLVARKPK